MDLRAVPRPPDDPSWASFVAGHPSALPFHHPAWAGMLAECYGMRAFALTLSRPDGRLAGVLPVVEVRRRPGRPRWVSLPFTDHCPPLLTTSVGAGRDDGNGSDGGNGATEWGTALDEARQAAGVHRFEIRAAVPGPAARPDGTYLTHRLPLDRPLADVFASLHANQVRRGIRRAERAGVTVRRGVTEDDLTGVFYRLHTRTRHRLGVPVQPRRYFRLLWRRILRPGLGVLLIAELAGEPVAAGVFLAGPGAAVYKYGASDERRWGARPNHPLFWEAIRWAAARGCEVFDFGRTDVGDDGLREFKSRWGTTEERLEYCVLTDRSVRAGRAGSGVPGPLRSVIRHGPRVVPRALGELLYRYTA